jgi:hypothetical protein
MPTAAAGRPARTIPASRDGEAVGLAQQPRTPASLRKGGGLVDAPGRWPVGAKGEYPFFEAHIRFGFVVYKARRSRAQSM